MLRLISFQMLLLIRCREYHERFNKTTQNTPTAKNGAKPKFWDQEPENEVWKYIRRNGEFPPFKREGLNKYWNNTDGLYDTTL